MNVKLKNGVWFELELELEGISVWMEHGTKTKISVDHILPDGVKNFFPLTIFADCVLWDDETIVSVDIDGNPNIVWLPRYIGGEGGNSWWIEFDIYHKLDRIYRLEVQIVDSRVHYVRLSERDIEEEVEK